MSGRKIPEQEEILHLRDCLNFINGTLCWENPLATYSLDMLHNVLFKAQNSIDNINYEYYRIVSDISHPPVEYMGNKHTTWVKEKKEIAGRIKNYGNSDLEKDTN